MSTTSLELFRGATAQGATSAAADGAKLARRSERIAQDAAALTGPGASAVRAAARQLVLALELYEQQHRRLAAEVLREEVP